MGSILGAFPHLFASTTSLMSYSGTSFLTMASNFGQKALRQQNQFFLAISMCTECVALSY